MVYEREIMRSQADYIVENIILKKSGGGQSSNYVGTEFFNDALEKGQSWADTGKIICPDNIWTIIK